MNNQVESEITEDLSLLAANVKKWVIEMFLSDKKVVELCARKNPFRFLCLFAYQYDVTLKVIPPIESTDEDNRTNIWKQAIYECENKLDKRNTIDFAKCLYWFNEIVKPYVD